MGVPTVQVQALGVLRWARRIGGLSGALWAGQASFINAATFRLENSILVLAAVLLGGAGNIGGAILGGFLVIYIPEWLRSVGDVFGLPETVTVGGQDYDVSATSLRYFFFGIILIVVMIFRPQGCGPTASGRASCRTARRRWWSVPEPEDESQRDVSSERDEAPDARIAGAASAPDRPGTPAPPPEPYDAEGDLDPATTEDQVVGPTPVLPGRTPLLEVDDVTLRFGGVVALNQVNFTLYEGEILGLIGPNGAGKTTCFNAMTGVYQPTEGQIRFRGQVAEGPVRATGSPRLGIARTFQNIRLFPEMTALENVMVGADAHHKTSVPSALLRLPRHWREERDGRDRSRELLDVRRHQGPRATSRPATCSYGDQRRLEIARALATRPTLLCLDEPAAGFNPAEKESLLQLIRRIRDTGVTVLLIEHDMRLVMGVTDRIVVLEFGKKIAEGSPAEVARQPEGDRGLPGGAGRCCLRSTTSPCCTAASRRCTASACTSTRARSSRSSARTAPARPRRCGRSPACGRWPPDGSGSTARTSRKLRADLRVIRGICQSPEGRGVFPGMTVRENLEMGAYTRRDGAGIAKDMERVLGAVPAAAGAAQAAGRHALRRRAADARGGAGADEPAQAAAARRALDGAGADADPADLRRSSRRSTSRARRSCWSSRTRSRPCPAPTGRTSWRPDGSSRRARASSCSRPRREGGLPRRGLTSPRSEPGSPSAARAPRAWRRVRRGWAWRVAAHLVVWPRTGQGEAPRAEPGARGSMRSCARRTCVDEGVDCVFCPWCRTELCRRVGLEFWP